jgi:putative ABC transport system ATP-binding protein
LLYQKVKGNERKGRIAEMLDRLNIVAKKDLFPNQLSGGQQQLIGIARALNAEGITIIQCTHSEKNAAYGSRIITLLDGWVDTDKRIS